MRSNWRKLRCGLINQFNISPTASVPVLGYCISCTAGSGEHLRYLNFTTHDCIRTNYLRLS